MSRIVRRLVNQSQRRHYIEELRRNQWKNIDELEASQLKKLKATITYAYHNIPFYHKLFDSAGFKPEDLRKQKDLKKIPTITKIDIRRNFNEFLPKGIDASKYIEYFTSGSTGIPLRVFLDWKAHNYSEALVHYPYFECGVTDMDRVVHVRYNLPKWKQSRIFELGFVRSLLIRFIESFVPVLDPLDKTIDLLREVNPDIILLHPSTLENLFSIDTSGINPRLIFTYAETLTEHVRQLVRSKFGLEVLDTYGSIEFLRLGFECPEHTGLHMITDCAVVEYLEDGEPVSLGEPGETVVTGLYNQVMPLIRYELGDLATPINDKCSCGRSWPLVKEIQGKIRDSFKLPNGKVILPLTIQKPIDRELKENLRCISHFQLIQEARDRVVLKIVKGDKFDQNVLNRVLSNTRNIVGENVDVVLDVVDKIEMEKSGKRRLVLSYV